MNILTIFSDTKAHGITVIFSIYNEIDSSVNYLKKAYKHKQKLNNLNLNFL